FPPIPPEVVVIDALFGTGLTRPPDGLQAEVIKHINASPAQVISIDLPSGLFADKSSARNAIVEATHTLSFQRLKLAFLLPENDEYCGKIHPIDISLDKQFELAEEAAFELVERSLARSIGKSRNKFSHKGDYGHAALLCGSYGMIGAAVLSARSCLRSGAGKLSCYIPECGYDIMQTSVPEAMCRVNGTDHVINVDDISNYDSIGIGPGIGKYSSHPNLLKSILTSMKRPVVIDADGLNIIASDKELLDLLPPHSILTPHPGEFVRLFGESANDFERLQMALQQSAKRNIYIVLKGHYSFISTPEGKGWFNSTGNPGMATAGSGDVLAGIITGLLAQGYPSLQAAILGVYLHGLAGDVAAQRFSAEAMIAGDIVDCLGEAFKLVL
ncbi:MAG TPA: NAD(P)H-hydrate dehydratase, partial [Ferruginibacter sp.]|nr:NAD(P)H-hydrate dehydratase [Ferruginibacter sp.]